MFEINKTKFDYSIDDIFAKDNIIGDILKTRGEFAADPDNYKIKYNKLETTFNTKPFVWQRNPNVTGPEIEIKDGIIYFYTPLIHEEESKGKEGSKFILHTGTMCIGYWNNNPVIEESERYLLNNQDDKESKEYKRAIMIKNNLALAPPQALYNILVKKIDNVVWVGNDVEINGKKICGGSYIQNYSGAHVQMGINYDYDEVFFKDILSDDEFHRKTQQGITGIKQELPTYTKEQFSIDFTNEVGKIIKETIQKLEEGL